MPSRTLPDNPYECIPRLYIVVDESGLWRLFAARDGQEGMLIWVPDGHKWGDFLVDTTMDYESMMEKNNWRAHDLAVLPEDGEYRFHGTVMMEMGQAETKTKEGDREWVEKVLELMSEKDVLKGDWEARFEEIREMLG